MRFSTIFAAATMVLLSVVSAQTKPDPAMVAACNTCITNAGIAAVPSCKGLERSSENGNGNTGSNATAPTDKQKACWCGLAANKTWLNQCVGADKCPGELTKTFQHWYETATAAPGFCDNMSASTSANDASRFCGASSVKLAAAGAAVVAIAGTLL
ncbi:MAG: hypothetical protein JOS17DRAFT_789437 [Linnemannia elongata]|nr:MAG: hypothetical protein JOS17DRAFT_789437 [Linnemannia elongata]